MFIEYLLAFCLFVAYMSAMLWSFGKLSLFTNSTISAKGLTLLFSIKLLFGIFLVLVYTFYYTERQYADIYKYFDDSKVIYDAVGEHPSTAFKVITGIRYDKDDNEIKDLIAPTQHFDKKGSGTIEANHRLVIRLHTVLRFISRGNIYIHTLFFCFLSFIGCVALYRGLQPFFEYGHGRLLIVPVFLVPSILFWSSGLLKETLVLFFLGLLLFSAFKLLHLHNLLSNLLIAVICIIFIWLLKPFIALSFLAAFYIMITINFKGYAKLVTILLGIVLMCWVFYAHDTFICEFMSSLIAKRNEFVELGLKMKAGSLTDTALREASCTEPLRLIPSALYNMFLQPAVWSRSLFEKIFGLENLLILMLSLLVLFYFKAPKRAKRQLAIFCLVFFILNYAVIGITTPIIGALVHYKIFGLLFYLILLCCIVSLRKLISDISRVPMGEKFLLMARKLVFR